MLRARTNFEETVSVAKAARCCSSSHRISGDSIVSRFEGAQSLVMFRIVRVTNCPVLGAGGTHPAHPKTKGNPTT